MKIRITAAMMAAALLSGCQTQQTRPLPVTVQPAASEALQIRNTLQQLYQDGALNQTTGHLVASFTANSDRLSLDWEGDAIELLAQLARQRGLNFGYTGVRLPLPVSVHVSNITFENLLRQLKTQMGWRATLKQQPLELHLYFALPDKGGCLA